MMRLGPHDGMKLTASSRATSSSSRPCSDFIAGISRSDSRLIDVNFERAAARRFPRDVEGNPHRTAFDGFFIGGRNGQAGHHCANGSSSRIDRDQTAADHDNLSAERNPIAAIDIEKIIDRLDDAVSIGIFDRNAAAARRAHRDEDRAETIGKQFANSETRCERRVVAKLDAHRFDLGSLPIDDFAREPIRGDPVAHHATWCGHRFEQSHPISHQRKIVRACHPGRAGADHRDARCVFAPVATLENLIGMQRRDAATAHRAGEDLLEGRRRERLRTELVGEKSFERADSDRGVDFAAPAGIFAGSAAAATAD